MRDTEDEKYTIVIRKPARNIGAGYLATLTNERGEHIAIGVGGSPYYAFLSLGSSLREKDFEREDDELRRLTPIEPLAKEEDGTDYN